MISPNRKENCLELGREYFAIIRFEPAGNVILLLITGRSRRIFNVFHAHDRRDCRYNDIYIALYNRWLIQLGHFLSYDAAIGALFFLQRYLFVPVTIFSLMMGLIPAIRRKHQDVAFRWGFCAATMGFSFILSCMLSQHLPINLKKDFPRHFHKSGVKKSIKA